MQTIDTSQSIKNSANKHAFSCDTLIMTTTFSFKNSRSTFNASSLRSPKIRFVNGRLMEPSMCHRLKSFCGRRSKTTTPVGLFFKRLTRSLALIRDEISLCISTSSTLLMSCINKINFSFYVINEL